MRHAVQLQTLELLQALHASGRDQAMLGKTAEIAVNRYTDPAVLDLELKSAFRHSPLLAGHASAVRAPGSYLLSDWDRFPYVIVRDQQGTLRAFLNACRHRGARLVSGREPCLQAMVCPFHGWSYALDGQLKGVTKAYDFPGMDRQRFSLVELAVVERAGLLWVHPTPGAAIDLDAALGFVSDDLDHFGLDELVRFRKTATVKKANWKLLVNTYLEGYHVPYLHRHTLASAFRNGVISHRRHGSHIRLAAARSNFPDLRHVPAEKRRILDFASVYYLLFPHAFFIMHPDYVSINSFHPLAPDRTLWTHEMLYRPADFPGEAGQQALAKRFTYTNDAVFDAEDFAVTEGIQQGLESGANAVHTLGLEEGLIAMFQQSVDDGVVTEGRSVQP